MHSILRETIQKASGNTPSIGDPQCNQFPKQAIIREQGWPPYMLIHEEDENLALQQIVIYAIDSKRSSENAHADRVAGGLAAEYRYLLFLQRARFFDTYKGFISGRLDLTGRHPSRWKLFMKGFNKYMNDFDIIAPTVEVTIKTRTIGRSGYTFEEPHYRMKDEVLWNRFARFWNVDADEVMEPSLQVYDMWKQNLQPRFQALSLEDFPQEVCDEIFDQCRPQDLRALAATSRLYWTRTRRHLLMRCHIRLRMDEGEDRDLAKERCLEQFAHRSSRLRECLTMRHLWVDLANAYPDPFSRSAWPYSNAYDLMLDGKYLAPLTTVLEHILSPHLIPNLTTLTLSTCSLTPPMVESITSLANLQTLALVYCEFSPEAVQQLPQLQDRTKERAPSIHNLSLIFPRDRPGEPTNLWFALHLCPSVTNLSLIGMYNLLTFPANFGGFGWTSNLQRLLVVDPSLDYDSYSNLVSWIAGISQENPSLTHFKLHSSDPLHAIHIYPLLRVLPSTTLKVLSLDGIGYHEAKPSLISRIARYHPDLESLSLFARANEYRQTLRAVVWTSPSWEYAYRFRPFKSLSHFEWNHAVSNPHCSPACLLELERLALPQEDKGEEQPDKDDDDEFDDGLGDIYWGDGHYNVAPFAAHCATLKTFSSQNPFYSTLEITRDGANAPKIRRPSKHRTAVCNPTVRFWSDGLPPAWPPCPL